MYYFKLKENYNHFLKYILKLSHLTINDKVLNKQQSFE